jgi:hypothetical protein
VHFHIRQLGANETRGVGKQPRLFPVTLLGYLHVIISRLMKATSSTVDSISMPKLSIRMFVLPLMLTLLGGVLTNGHQLNIVLLADTSTDVRQWPDIVDWAQMRIENDRLLPENYTVKWVIRAQFIYGS